MDIDLGADLLRDHEDTRIRNDERIRLHVLQVVEVLPDPRKIPVVSENIGRYVHFDAAGVCKLDAFPKFL